MPGKAAKVTVTEKQFDVLTEFSKARTESLSLVQRSKIILLAFEKHNNEAIELKLGIGHDAVGKSRRRWQKAWEKLTVLECNGTPAELKAAIRKLLADAPRAGRKPQVSPQLWSKDKVTDRLFEQKVQTVCDVYREAIDLYDRQGIHTISVDEMTGIQALERIAPDRWPIAGESTRREYEYRRHGTTGLFGNLHVATGEICSPLVRDTRTEEDFVENLDGVISRDPEAGYRFVMDNLTTHASESLVRYVAASIGYGEDLGKKGVRGILQSVATRKEFLSDRSHRIWIAYTPRHCSWLNQIEMWFSTLRRKVTGSMSFESVDHLSDRLLNFIEYYNADWAHPYRWTYQGRVLVA